MRRNGITHTTLPDDWFHDETRTPQDNRGPHVVIVDDFYGDPDAVRALGLSREFVQFTPPLAEQVGADVASLPEFEPIKGAWRSTALLRFRGKDVAKPFVGFRHNPEWLRCEMERITGESIGTEAWALGGDGWNGAFHLRDAGHTSASIHHHYKEGDVYPRGWSGLVYLSPGAPRNSGTSFWRSKDTGKCVASPGVAATKDYDRFEKVFVSDNVYNRLVLFRENVLHRAEPGFGEDKDARLTQTFFFISRPPAPS